MLVLLHVYGPGWRGLGPIGDDEGEMGWFCGVTLGHSFGDVDARPRGRHSFWRAIGRVVCVM